MSQISPNYRNDSTDGLDTRVIEYLDTHYLANLKNIKISHPKLLVVFSGGNAVGKTTLAAKIQSEFDALVLENDAIKQCIREMQPGLERDMLNKMTWQYSMRLYGQIDTITQNGLVVRDAVIDWYYDRVLPIFISKGYELCIIAFDLSREKAEEIINNRGDTTTIAADRQIALLDEHEIHIRRFRKDYKPNITLTDETLFNHQAVLDKLRTRLKDLKSE